MPEKELPRRSPQNYTTDDIKKGVDGLYVAIRREGAPRGGDEVVIGNNQKSKNGTVLQGKFIYGVKLTQKQVFLKKLITLWVKIIKIYKINTKHLV